LPYPKTGIGLVAGFSLGLACFLCVFRLSGVAKWPLPYAGASDLESGACGAFIFVFFLVDNQLFVFKKKY
jgi:hypothetical protein